MKYESPVGAWIVKCSRNSSVTLGHVVLLLITLGFPRFPGSDVPLCAVLIVSHFKYVIHLFTRLESIKCLYPIILFFLFGFSLWLIHDGNSSADLVFLTSICIKAVLNIFIALLLAPILLKDGRSLLIWIFIQVVLIAISVLDERAFQFLTIFSGQSGYDVYSSLFNLRGVGFGIVHVYGGITFLGASFLYASIISQTFLGRYILFLMQSVALLVSRSAIPILGIFLLLFEKLMLLVFVVLFLALSYYISVVDAEGVLGQVLELGVSLIETNSLTTKSTEASMAMWVFPGDIYSAIAGYGKFFDEGLFFMGTDVGYSRISLFGGFPLLLLFIYANVYCVSVVLLKSQKTKYKKLALVYLLIFFAINLKGLADVGVFAYILLFISQYERAQSKRNQVLPHPLPIDIERRMT